MSSEMESPQGYAKTLAQANYLGEVAEVRAAVLGRMAQLGSIGHETDFAVFFDEDIRKETLLLINRSSGAPETAPSQIRLLSMERVESELGLCFLTEDVMLYADGDAQMLVDAAILDENGDADAKSNSQLFYVQAGSLALPKFKRSPPVGTFSDEVDGVQVTVTPFGYYQCLEDRLCAVDRARQVVEATEVLEPTFFGFG